MAEIPVREKSSSSWIWWLLAAILIALLLWWLLADADDDDVDVYDADTEIAANGTVDDMDAMNGATAGATGLAALAVGDDVDLDGVRVASVTGDMSFMVTDDSGEQVMVVFDQERTPGDATEGEFDINDNMLLDIEGRVLSGDDDLPEGVDADIPPGTDRVIYADSISVAERSDTPGTTTAE